jgi:hypothetical protein
MPGIDNENQAELNERHKQDQLQKQKEGKGHWKPELASNSEEAVNFPLLADYSRDCVTDEAFWL